jgi:hypothetical protein
MKGIAIHGALLAVMLGVAYQTWTRDTTIRVSTGEVAIWDRAADDVTAVTFETVRKDATTGASNARTVRVERRGTGADAYWWGIETRTDQKPKPAPVPDAGVPADAAIAVDGGAAKGDAGAAKGDAGAGDAGAAKPTDAGAPKAGDAALAKADAGVPPDAPGVTDAGAPPPVGELETKTTTREFPIGDKFPVAGAPNPMTFADLLGSWASMHAVLALDELTDAKKQEYELADSTTTFTVILKDGPHAFVLGGKVAGSKERYAMSTDDKKGYILAGAMLDPLESGEGALAPASPNGFDATDVGQVVISAGGKTRQADRISTASDKGAPTRTWGDRITLKADQTLANFVDKLEKLRAQSYAADLKIADLTAVVALAYKDGTGKPLGTLTLYKRDTPSDKPVAPPAAPATVTEYYIVTETTRVPAKVPTPIAEGVEQDLGTVFAN